MDKSPTHFAIIPIIIIFILILLFTGCTDCPSSCQGTCYDPGNESCCNGQLYSGKWSPCGVACYDNATQVCYEGAIYNGTYWSVLGTWEAEADPSVTMTLLPNGSVVMDPFPRCNHTLKSIGNWSCSSSRLSNGTWSWDPGDEHYLLDFGFCDTWDGFDMNPNYTYGDPYAAYNPEKPDRWRTNPPVPIKKDVNGTVTYESDRGTAASRVLRLHVASPSKELIFDYYMGYGYMFPYYMNWTTNDYGTWRRASDRTSSGYIPAATTPPEVKPAGTPAPGTPSATPISTMHITTIPTPTLPAAAAPDGIDIYNASGGEGLSVTDYTGYLYTNGTLVEEYSYRVSTPNQYSMLYRSWNMPLTLKTVDRPHVEFVRMTAPQGTTGYLKDTDGQVTLVQGGRNETLEQLISAMAERNETGLWKADYFAPGTYTVGYVFDLHPSIKYDSNTAYLSLNLASTHLPYGKVRIVLPARHVMKVTPGTASMVVTKEGDMYTITGMSGKDEPLQLDLLLSPDVKYEMDGFYVAVDKVPGI